MDFILKTSCRKTDRPSQASLGILRSPLDGKPLHGFVPLDENLVFTKNGLSKRAKNEIQNAKQMIAIHTAAAKKVCPTSPAECAPLVIEYYSCEQLPSFSVENLMTLA
ncbi:MAG: hypothetical protein KF789_00245 [Bdellovibrionaceae bacterium]|nr:hypothetical protein [Pseudobdellovibrionaceae bacterium]